MAADPVFPPTNNRRKLTTPSSPRSAVNLRLILRWLRPALAPNPVSYLRAYYPLSNQNQPSNRLLNGRLLRRFDDQIGDHFREGQHRDVARRDFDRRGLSRP